MKTQSIIINSFYTLSLCLIMFSTTVYAQNEETIRSLPSILPLILNDDSRAAVVCPTNPAEVELNLSDGSAFIDSIDALNNLNGVTRVVGNLIFVIEPSGTQLNANTDYSTLNSITEVTGFIAFQFVDNENDTLFTLDVFPCLTDIGLDLFMGDPEITSNTSLQELQGFESLTNVGRSISISDHDDLQTLPSFDNLETIGARLSIGFTPSLENLPTFNSLMSIGSGISIREAGTFSQILGFNSLQTINGLGGPRFSVISGNTGLICNEDNVPLIFLPATVSEGNVENCPL